MVLTGHPTARYVIGLSRVNNMMTGPGFCLSSRKIYTPVITLSRLRESRLVSVPDLFLFWLIWLLVSVANRSRVYCLCVLSIITARVGKSNVSPPWRSCYDDYDHCNVGCFFSVGSNWKRWPRHASWQPPESCYRNEIYSVHPFGLVGWWHMHEGGNIQVPRLGNKKFIK